MTFKSVSLSLCYGLIKRSQNFGRFLNNATLTQTHQKRQITQDSVNFFSLVILETPDGEVRSIPMRRKS
ncbi:MAG: hypothetical protein O4805_03650 [Trichodesmium sp. St16_bin2-tuft]|jgi:hypothetical protein|nr:hypothetical protein [Trichodesmium sp. St18_bin1]MDE5086287.1 hypothetical protein [Trichodesmium sp. St16_bin2-tuft]MDE5106795.1 hypothetical protein [Trichodesmium sp. St17_bin3_1_1]MDE5120612.1 hypothetical protein [Trichodesmium sp. St19_bin1]